MTSKIPKITALLAAATITFMAQPAWSEESSRAGTVGITVDGGYYTYGMSDVNARYQGQDITNFNGGLGFGAGIKVYLTNSLAAKAGIDYLLAAKDAKRTIGGITYNSRVDMPATLTFLGGEFDLLPGGPLNIKLIGGMTFVSIYNGKEQTTDSNRLDLGTVTGTGIGFQVGAGAEFYLLPALSIEADVCYNKARIDGATFAGSPADPATASMNDAVDYSGIVAKVAVTLYLGSK